jgi:lipoate-protein ligase A
LTAIWSVERRSGSAAALHERPLGPEVIRRVSVLEVERPALVLGSTQRETDADAHALAAFDVELARRRSGGGAVLLVPGQTLWIDIEIPRTDVLWDDDVGRASHWLGRAWVVALAELGVHAEVHTGGVLETAWSRKVCFGGLGPGEVSVSGHKLVGISQRRTREGARFQCLVHRRWDPVPLLGLLALHHRERAGALVELTYAGAGLDVEDRAVIEALVRQLPAH